MPEEDSGIVVMVIVTVSHQRSGLRCLRRGPILLMVEGPRDVRNNSSPTRGSHRSQELAPALGPVTVIHYRR